MTKGVFASHPCLAGETPPLVAKQEEDKRLKKNDTVTTAIRLGLSALVIGGLVGLMTLGMASGYWSSPGQEAKTDLEKAKTQFDFEREKAYVMADNVAVPLDQVEEQIGRMVKAEFRMNTALDRDKSITENVQIPRHGDRKSRCRAETRRWQTARRALDARGMDLKDIDRVLAVVAKRCGG